MSKRHPKQVSPYGPVRTTKEKPVNIRQETMQEDLKRLEMVQEVRPMLPPNRRPK